MLDTESPIAAIYTTSTMEHHHFNQTVTILQQVHNNRFSFNINYNYLKKNTFTGRSQHIWKAQQQRIQTSFKSSQTLYIGHRFGIVFPQQGQTDHPNGRGEIFVEHS